MRSLSDEDVRNLGLAIADVLPDQQIATPIVVTIQLFDHRRVAEISAPGFPVKRVVVSRSENHW